MTTNTQKLTVYWGIIFIAIICFSLNSCQKKELPKVKTFNVTEITDSTAIVSGEVISDGNSEVIARGIIWNLSGDPSFKRYVNYTQDGSGLGEFTGHITNLISDKTYYMRAYATNSEGTAYGEVIAIKSSLTLYSKIPDTIVISFSDESRDLTIENYGNIDLEFSANVSNDNISLSKNSGIIKIDGSKVISISPNRKEMSTGTYESELQIEINERIHTSTVKVHNINEHKIILPSEVIDAGYSKANDILVFISPSPHKLIIFYPDTRITEYVPLSFKPTCLSISPDGNEAIVGHAGYISYIDLINRSVIRTYPVSIDPSTVVLGNNKWGYAIQRRNSADETIRCINLNIDTPNETHSTGGNVVLINNARLHPSGKYIYAINASIGIGAATSKMKKYDIQNDTAKYLYSQTSSSGAAIHGNIWFSEDGSRIFTGIKTVFNADENIDYDMTYDASISAIGTYILWLDHSWKNNEVYFINSGTSSDIPIMPYIYAHNYTSLEFERKYNIEQYYLIGSNESLEAFAAIPHYVFCNSTGSELYVLTKPAKTYPTEEWSIQIIDVE